MMSQINNRGIQNNEVLDTKIRLQSNAYLRSRNTANSADVNIVHVNSADKIEFPTIPQAIGTPSASADLATVNYVQTYVGGVSTTFAKESKTLTGTDITNQYVDLAQVAKASSIDLVFNGLVQIEGVDYTVNLTGGAGGKTRVTFSGDLATGGPSALISGDIIYFKYSY